MLDDNGKAALQNYLDLGGNFIGIHSASDALRTTTFYGNEVGKSCAVTPARPTDPDFIIRGLLRLSPGAPECGECYPSGVALK